MAVYSTRQIGADSVLFTPQAVCLTQQLVALEILVHMHRHAQTNRKVPFNGIRNVHVVFVRASLM